MTGWRTTGLLALLSCLACSAGTDGLDSSFDAGTADRQVDAAALVECEEILATSYESADGGNVPVLTFTAVRCPVGALCAATPNICACAAPGGMARCTGGIPLEEQERRYRSNNPNYPRCSRDSEDECGQNNRCYFEPGCENPSGFCCWGTKCSDSLDLFCPDCLTYCGCDGVTYEGPPVRPYRHPGACR